jgi:hypothetical protein
MGEYHENLGESLHSLLGDEGYLSLLEAYGGLRLYVPQNTANSNLSEDIGEEPAKLLSDEYGREYIRVPLAREFRALQYRKNGWTNRQIASRLCLTESGLERIFQKLRSKSPALVPPPPPRPKAVSKPVTGAETKRAVADARTQAIKAFFLENATSAPTYRPQFHLVAAFNKTYAGRYALTRSAGYHWYRWALEALRKEKRIQQLRHPGAPRG